MPEDGEDWPKHGHLQTLRCQPFHWFARAVEGRTDKLMQVVFSCIRWLDTTEIYRT